VDATSVASEALPKAACYISLAIIIGLVVVRWMLGRAAGTPAEAVGSLSALAVLAAGALAFSSLMRLIGHTVAAFGPADALAWENLRLIAIESRWGMSWQIQFFAASLVLAAAIAIRSRGGRGWPLLAVTALIACAATPLLGHAAGSAWRGMLHASHVLAGGAWLGTLIVIVLVEWMTARDRRASLAFPETGDLAGPIATGLVSQFSPVALTAAAVVFASGLLAAVVYLTALADLLHSAYGRALTIKLTLVLGILVCGYANWQRARARRAPWMPLLRAEATLALLVLIVTSVLTELEHP
jgi:putative copper export protein